MDVSHNCKGKGSGDSERANDLGCSTIKENSKIDRVKLIVVAVPGIDIDSHGIPFAGGETLEVVGIEGETSTGDVGDHDVIVKLGWIRAISMLEIEGCWAVISRLDVKTVLFSSLLP